MWVRMGVTDMTRLTIIGAVAIERRRGAVTVFLLILVFKVHIKRPVGKIEQVRFQFCLRKKSTRPVMRRYSKTLSYRGK